MTNFIHFFNNFESSDLLFSAAFIGISSFLLFTFIQSMSSNNMNETNKEATPGNNGESPNNQDSNFVPLSFNNKEDKAVQPIHHTSNKHLRHELTSKFLKVQSVDEMRALYGSRLVDLYISRYGIDTSNSIDFVKMGLEIEKIIKLDEVFDIFSVFGSLGYPVPSIFQNSGERTPTLTSQLELNATLSADIAFIARNHHLLLESDIAESADIVTADSPDSEGSTDYYPQEINNPF